MICAKAKVQNYFPEQYGLLLRISLRVKVVESRQDRKLRWKLCHVTRDIALNKYWSSLSFPKDNTDLYFYFTNKPGKLSSSTCLYERKLGVAVQIHRKFLQLSRIKNLELWTNTHTHETNITLTDKRISTTNAMT